MNRGSIGRAAAGDNLILADLLNEHHDELLALAQPWTGPALSGFESAEELVQECLVDCFAQIASLQTSEESPAAFRAWLAEIVKNCAMRHSLAHLHGELLTLVCARMSAELKTKTTDDDILQEVGYKVMRSAATFVVTPERLAASFRSWVNQIIEHTIIDAARRKSLVALGSELIGELQEQGGLTPSRIVSNKEAEVIVRQCLQALPEDWRLPLVWHHQEGVSVEDVALRMGRSIEAAKQLLKRAREGLRHEIGNSSLFYRRT
jgi:RNA polymerase sigma factor (sigma-70 family)